MSYDTLEKQIRMLPEDCLDDVSHYIEFIIYRMQLRDKKQKAPALSAFFRIMNKLPDGLEAQRGLRNERDYF